LEITLQSVSLPLKLAQMKLRLLAVWLFASITASAQDGTLDPVTVTSTMVPERASKTGRNVVTLKGEKITQLPVTSIDELLRYIPGLEVQMRGPAGSQSDLSVRGSTFQQVLVILDGVRLNDPNTGHFNSYIPIAPAEIDRIEVLKGASSALYGSEAVGGVIHIITKTFAAKQGEAHKNLQLQTSVGEFESLNVNAGGFYQKGNTALSIGVLSANADGQQQRGIKGYFHNNTVSASLNQYINQYWNISIRSAYDSRDFAAQNFYTTFVSDTANEQVKTFWNQLRVGYKKNKSRLSILGGYKTADDTYQFNSVGLPNKSKSKLAQGSVIYDYSQSEQINYIVGVQYQNKAINSNDRGKHNLSQTAGFVSLNYNPTKKLTINPALRLDWIEGVGTELVPQVNLSYRLNKFQLRGSAGKTIRDADFTERFNNYNKAFVASGRIGNPDLDPERSFSYEVGTDYLLSNTLKISASVFQRYQTKLIDYVTTPYAQMPRKENLSPTGTYALAKNISKVTTTGAEFDIQFVRNFSSKQSLWATAGFVWLDDNSSAGTPSLYISSHAKYIANFNLQYKINWLRLAVNGLYKKRNPQVASAINAKVSEEYFVMNSRLEALMLKEKLSLFVQVDNLFDKNYQDVLGSQMPGRWLMGGFKINL
jgi:iron complex outermembrane receptor protein